MAAGKSRFSRWFRVYDEFSDDPKIQTLGDRLGFFLVNCWCLASRNGGYLPSVADMAWKLRKKESEIAAMVATLHERGLLDREADTFSPHNWHERQYVSDSSTERVRRYREGKKQKGNAGETLHGSSGSGFPSVSDAVSVSASESVAEKPGNGAAPITPLNTQSEYPLTLSEIRFRDPSIDEMFVLRLVQETTQYLLSHPKFPQNRIEAATTDKVIARACGESFSTGPKNHGAGLLLNRVPRIIVTWGTENGNGR